LVGIENENSRRVKPQCPTSRKEREKWGTLQVPQGVRLLMCAEA
jgi:hypothetical protein